MSAKEFKATQCCPDETLRRGRNPGARRCRRSLALGGLFQIFLLCSLLPIVFPEQVQAQGVYKPAYGEWEFSVFAGGSFIGSDVHETPVEESTHSSSRDVGLSYGSGGRFGIRVTNNRWQHWGTSFEYTFSNQPITFTNLSDSMPSLGLGHAIHRFAYDVVYYPRDRYEKLRPFVFGGPGVSLFDIKSSGTEAGGIRFSDPWKFTVNWGGGVKYAFSEQVAALFQFSDNISGVPGYGLPETGRVVSGEYVPGFRPDGLLNNWAVEVGFSFHWDH